jgi:Domain of unknown function (DU1801)
MKRVIFHPPVGLLEFLYRFDPAVHSMTLGLRQLVLSEIAPCHELVLSMGAKLSLIYSASERVIADGICYVAPYRQHVNLGFFRGVDLDDPRHLLRGTGKAMRHLQVKRLADLDRPEFRMFVREARRNAGAPPRRGTATEVISRVKRSARQRVEEF